MRGKLESLFPPALFVLATAMLLRGTWARGSDGDLLGALVLLAYLGWLVLEIRITFQGATEETSSGDRGSLQLYGMSRMVVLGTLVTLTPVWDGWSPLRVLAAAAFLAGVVLRLGSIHQLGRFYSHRVRTVAEHRIVRTGPYRVLRHPSYAGMVLAHLGVVLVLLNPVSPVLFAALMVPAIIWRILVEEETLMRLDAYPAYAAGRPRLIPAVW
ncbi:methyltransferase family protein [Saccharopolyspora sp. MS10]|uniref:methyltransferase family protein n=1 Tax=Saccharopolyspora sp. MS10 TaxID=3385973 RepID=UPI0039A131DE